jgi:hypothetical protein
MRVNGHVFMYLCATGIDCPYLYDISIEIWNYPATVVYFVFHIISKQNR